MAHEADQFPGVSRDDGRLAVATSDHVAEYRRKDSSADGRAQQIALHAVHWSSSRVRLLGATARHHVPEIYHSPSGQQGRLMNVSLVFVHATVVNDNIHLIPALAIWIS
jgi:hypothetical protein